MKNMHIQWKLITENPPKITYEKSPWKNHIDRVIEKVKLIQQQAEQDSKAQANTKQMQKESEHLAEFCNILLQIISLLEEKLLKEYFKTGEFPSVFPILANANSLLDRFNKFSKAISSNMYPNWLSKPTETFWQLQLQALAKTYNDEPNVNQEILNWGKELNDVINEMHFPFNYPLKFHYDAILNVATFFLGRGKQGFLFALLELSFPLLSEFSKNNSSINAASYVQKVKKIFAVLMKFCLQDEEVKSQLDLRTKWYAWLESKQEQFKQEKQKIEEDIHNLELVKQESIDSGLIAKKLEGVEGLLRVYSEHQEETLNIKNSVYFSADPSYREKIGDSKQYYFLIGKLELNNKLYVILPEKMLVEITDGQWDFIEVKTILTSFIEKHLAELEKLRNKILQLQQYYQNIFVVEKVKSIQMFLGKINNSLKSFASMKDEAVLIEDRKRIDQDEIKPALALLNELNQQKIYHNFKLSPENERLIIETENKLNKFVYEFGKIWRENQLERVLQFDRFHRLDNLIEEEQTEVKENEHKIHTLESELEKLSTEDRLLQFQLSSILKQKSFYQHKKSGQIEQLESLESKLNSIEQQLSLLFKKEIKQKADLVFLFKTNLQSMKNIDKAVIDFNTQLEEFNPNNMMEWLKKYEDELELPAELLRCFKAYLDQEQGVFKKIANRVYSGKGNLLQELSKNFSSEKLNFVKGIADKFSNQKDNILQELKNYLETVSLYRKHKVNLRNIVSHITTLVDNYEHKSQQLMLIQSKEQRYELSLEENKQFTSERKQELAFLKDLGELYKELSNFETIISEKHRILNSIPSTNERKGPLLLAENSLKGLEAFEDWASQLQGLEHKLSALKNGNKKSNEINHRGLAFIDKKISNIREKLLQIEKFRRVLTESNEIKQKLDKLNAAIDFQVQVMKEAYHRLGNNIIEADKNLKCEFYISKEIGYFEHKAYIRESLINWRDSTFITIEDISNKLRKKEILFNKFPHCGNSFKESLSLIKDKLRKFDNLLENFSAKLQKNTKEFLIYKSREDICTEYKNKLDNYLIERRKRFRTKDFFFPSDRNRRVKFVNELKTALDNYMLTEEKRDNILTMLEKAKKDFPGKVLVKDILIPLQHELRKDHSQLHSEVLNSILPSSSIVHEVEPTGSVNASTATL